MKFVDVRRLGLISIQTKEKSTKNTVRGIILGLAILVPVVFFALSFNYGLNKEVDKMRTLASFNIVSTVNESQINNIPDSSVLDGVKNISGVTDVVEGEYIIFNSQNSSYINLEIRSIYDNYSFNFDFSLGSNKINPTIKICDINKPLFTDSEYNDLLNLGTSSSPYKAGFGFVDDGVSQVVISESILNYYGVSAINSIGSYVDISFQGNQIDLIDIDTNPNNEVLYQENTQITVPVIKSYQIVGVLKEDFLGLPSRINESHIWISDASIKDGDDYIFPVMNFHIVNEEVKPIYTYSSMDLNDYATTITNSGRVFLPIGYGINYSYNVDQAVYHQRIKSSIVQCDSFARALTIEDKISNEYRKLDIIDYTPNQNPLYKQVRTISTIATYVLLVLVGFSLIVLITTLLNLFNTINYSVESRRHYIGVMKAIGAKKKTITNLYFVELLLILSRTFVWVFSIGGIISIIIKYVVDEGLEKFKDIIPYEFKLNLWYFPLSFGVILIFEFLIAFIFSNMACVRTNNKPILEILKDER